MAYKVIIKNALNYFFKYVSVIKYANPNSLVFYNRKEVLRMIYFCQSAYDLIKFVDEDDLYNNTIFRCLMVFTLKNLNPYT